MAVKVKTEVLMLNPRIDAEELKNLEANLFKAKNEDNIKVDKSKLVRAFVKKFNQDPDGVLKDLGFTS